jgi:hypothetical protein
MIISKRKLRKYMEKLWADTRAEKLGQDYTSPISEEQKKKNIYLQGFEDGTDNFFNAVCHKFNIKSNHRVG